MKTMRIILGLFLLLLISCGKTINSNEILNNENDFKLTIYLENKYSSDSSKVEVINRDSEKIAKLRNWISKNAAGWQRTIASWGTPEISLIGTNIRLLIFKDVIVVGFTDKKGKAQQYTKPIIKSQFDFLFD